MDVGEKRSITFENGVVETEFFENYWRVFFPSDCVDLRREVFAELKRMGMEHSIFIRSHSGLVNYIKVWKNENI